MTEQRALALIPTAEELRSMSEIAKAMHESGYFPDLKSIGQAIVKAEAGREWGYGPFEAMLAIAVVQGKPTLTAQAVAARVKRSGKYNYRLREHTAEACELEFFEGGQSVGTSRFTIDDAKKAGLTGKQVWQAYAESMLFARALTKGARMYCPDVFGAAPAYTAEEMGADVSEAGDVVSLPAESVRVIEPVQQLDKPTSARPNTYVEQPAQAKPVEFNDPKDALEGDVIPPGVRRQGDEAVDAYVQIRKSLRGAETVEALADEWKAAQAYLRGLNLAGSVLMESGAVKDSRKVALQTKSV